jgi:hypothetical protein
MNVKDLAFTKGKTFALALRWETSPIVYKAITGITKTAPARLTVPSHVCPDGWRVAVTNVRGMTEINAANPNSIKASEYRQATVIDANTIDLNGVDAAGFHAYVSGGYLRYNTPVDLTGFDARMSVRAKVTPAVLLECSVGGVAGTTKPTGAGTDGTVTWVSTTTGVPTKEWEAGATYAQNDIVDLTELLRLSVTNGRISIDTARHTISLNISAADTALLDWRTGVYDLELVSPDPVPVVTCLLSGRITVGNEVTTT